MNVSWSYLQRNKAQLLSKYLSSAGLSNIIRVIRGAVSSAAIPVLKNWISTEASRYEDKPSSRPTAQKYVSKHFDASPHHPQLPIQTPTTEGYWYWPFWHEDLLIRFDAKEYWKFRHTVKHLLEKKDLSFLRIQPSFDGHSPTTMYSQLWELIA